MEKLAKDLINVTNDIRILGSKWAEAEALYKYQKDLNQNQLEIIKSFIASEGKKVSDAELTRIARTREDWKVECEKLFIAHKEALLTKALYDASKAKHEALRSIISLEKAKAQIL